MRVIYLAVAVAVVAAIAGCDLRNETGKAGVEKYNATPTPAKTPERQEPPVNPAEVVQVDTSSLSEPINVDGPPSKKTITCPKVETVTINSHKSNITIKGPRRRLTVNGDDNTVTGDAFLEIFINGDRNTITYARYINGKQPLITNIAASGSVSKAAATPAANK